MLDQYDIAVQQIFACQRRVEYSALRWAGGSQRTRVGW